MTIAMQAGKFYRDANNDMWLCYRVDLSGPPDQLAHAIRVRDDTVQHFFTDGRHEVSGTHKTTIKTAL